MTEPTRNRWRGMPADARAAERQATLVEVAFDLVGTDGMAGTTVRKVCEVARLNPRYFYESFEDLDALVVAVFDRAANDVVQATIMAFAELTDEQREDRETMLRIGIGAIVRHLTEDPRRARVIFMEGLNNEALGRRRFDTLHEMANTLVTDARRDAEQIAGEPVELASIVTVAANLMVGGMAELCMSWVLGRLDVTLDELVNDTASLFVAIAGAMDGITTKRQQEACTAGDGAGAPDRSDAPRSGSESGISG
jgi:AcrR family transcriptional regulator